MCHVALRHVHWEAASDFVSVIHYQLNVMLHVGMVIWLTLLIHKRYSHREIFPIAPSPLYVLNVKIFFLISVSKQTQKSDRPNSVSVIDLLH
jgi:hypothetical protein